ncbi:unnamed protein product [Rotaria sordida]|uniref:Uncharacterized protein n=1 Tax=Rotaria sordida TaxID=392033 RepID=A0A815LJL4_9BILA|nr:unnamed protein product [Rotaria sordida]
MTFGYFFSLFHTKMQSTPFSTSTSSSWMTSNNNSNLNTNNSNFWSNGGSRKRKVAVTDLDEKINQKMFVTEEKMVKEMQTLSLDLLPSLNNNNNNNTIPITTSSNNNELILDEIQTNQKKEDDNTDDDDDDDEKEKCSEETRFELHKLLKKSLKNDELQDSLISKLCDIERRKLTMQIVPYMPIHPAQLNNDKTKEQEEDKIIDNKTSSPIISDEIKYENNDHIFKIPTIPTAYTVEEPPCETTTKRSSTMKRSYSQSNQYNNSLLVTELKSDVDDYSTIHQSQSAYFIDEPTTTPISQALSNSPLSSDGPSIQIAEVVENSTSSNEFSNVLDDDDIDMQSVASSDTGDKMDDD